MNFDAELSTLRQPLLRFAQMRLRDTHSAEDVVSETMLAMLERPDAFSGASSLRTYATGILKHKIVDTLRRKGRELPIEPLDDQSYDDAIDALWSEDGHWRDVPPAWPTPDAELERRQFLSSLQACVDRLPDRLARVFMMRESLDLETDAICSDLGITANHCGVLLYRARMQLRECLELTWVAP
jgi:RNA polymerase sigma-70 factor, ECF subfamily